MRKDDSLISLQQLYQEISTLGHCNAYDVLQCH